MFWGAFSWPTCQKREFWTPTKKLADNFFFWYFCVFFFFFRFFVGGFKGQVRWPEGPPHLALNPPYFCCLFFCLYVCLFVSFVFFESLRVR